MEYIARNPARPLRDDSLRITSPSALRVTHQIGVWCSPRGRAGLLEARFDLQSRPAVLLRLRTGVINDRVCQRRWLARL